MSALEHPATAAERTPPVVIRSVGRRIEALLAGGLLLVWVLAVTMAAGGAVAATGSTGHGAANSSLAGVALQERRAGAFSALSRSQGSVSVSRAGDEMHVTLKGGTITVRLYQDKVVEMETNAPGVPMEGLVPLPLSRSCQAVTKDRPASCKPSYPIVGVGSPASAVQAAFGKVLHTSGTSLFLVGSTQLQGSLVHTYFDLRDGKVAAIRMGFFPWLTPCFGGPTRVPAGALAGNATWGLRGCPYIVLGQVTVPQGATLTVQAGVTVKFSTQSSGLAVAGGALLAQGTADTPVVFTSLDDQTHAPLGAAGGKGGALPRAGDWAGLSTTAAGGSLTLRHAAIYYGGATGSGIALAAGGTPTLSVQDSTIAYNHGYGIDAANAPAGTLIQRTAFFGNDRPLQISAVMSLDGSNTFAPTGLQPNKQNGIWLPWRAVLGANGTKVVWAENRTPFVLVNTARVAQGGTLDLGPGVTVKAFDDGTLLRIDGGTLVADGTATEPVVFTAMADRAHGGGNAGAMTAKAGLQRGAWAGLSTGDNGATITLRYTQVLYAGAGGYNHAGLVVIHNGNPTVDVEHCTFAMNNGWGLDAGDAPATLKIESTTFYGNDKPLQINGGISLDATNIFHGPQPNKQNGVFFVDGSHLDAGVTTTLSQAEVPFVVLRGLSINAGAHLTLGPGVIMKGFDTSAGLQVNGGSLTVAGTAARPVVLTSFPDDAHGGDTNGDGAASRPRPGNWLGLWISGAGQATLTHLQVFYGAADTFHYGALRVEDSAEVTIADSEVAQSAGNGIYVSTSRAASLTTTSVHNNAGFGIDFTNTTNWKASTQSGNRLSANAKGNLGVADQPAPTS